MPHAHLSHDRPLTLASPLLPRGCGSQNLIPALSFCLSKSSAQLPSPPPADMGVSSHLLSAAPVLARSRSALVLAISASARERSDVSRERRASTADRPDVERVEAGLEGRDEEEEWEGLGSREDIWVRGSCRDFERTSFRLHCQILVLQAWSRRGRTPQRSIEDGIELRGYQDSIP